MTRRLAILALLAASLLAGCSDCGLCVALGLCERPARARKPITVWQFAHREVADGLATGVHIGWNWTDTDDPETVATDLANKWRMDLLGAQLVYVNVEEIPRVAEIADWPDERIARWCAMNVAIINACRHVAPTARIGVTGILDSNYETIDALNAGKPEAARALVVKLKPVIAAADVLMPWIYLQPGRWTDGIETWVPKLAAEWACLGKPTIPVIWHRYNATDYPPVPRERYLALCNALRKAGVTDVGLWRGWNMPLDEGEKQVVEAGLEALRGGKK